jgi:hypothetical protein
LQGGGGQRFVPGEPYRLLMTVTYLIDSIARPLGIKHPFSPVRIRKLVRSNNILRNYLVENVLNARTFSSDRQSHPVTAICS